MELDTDLQDIEEQSFRRAFFADGLLDLMLGVFFLLWAIEAYYDQGGFGAINFVLLMPIYAALRKRITEPRVGVVKFRPQRRRRQKAIQLLFAGVFALVFVLGLVVYFAHSGRAESPTESQIRLAPLPLGVVFAMMLTLVGFKYEIQRAFGYAMWIVLAFVATVFVNHLISFDDLSLALGISCLTPLLVGSVMLGKFLRRYPRA